MERNRSYDLGQRLDLRDSPGIVEQAGCVTDLRRHKRIQTHRTARLSVDGVWHDCIAVDLSGGGARVVVDLGLEPGRTVVLADMELGLLAGTVQRSCADGLSLAFGVPEEKKRELVDQLTCYLNQHLLT